MPKRKIFDSEGHAQFVTFSTYHRRRLLDMDRPRNIVMALLGIHLQKQQGHCLGFVIMLDHVHALVWFTQIEQLSTFMKHWKEDSSLQIHEFYKRERPEYVQGFLPSKEFVWQRRYYPFNVYSIEKVYEKLRYMHNNPVRAGLVKDPCDWRWSSARFYEQGKSVGIKVGLDVC